MACWRSHGGQAGWMGAVGGGRGWKRDPLVTESGMGTTLMYIDGLMQLHC